MMKTKVENGMSCKRFPADTNHQITAGTQAAEILKRLKTRAVMGINRRAVTAAVIC